MDELDLLKKDWNKQSTHKKLSVKDIYPMLHKKSSSIVKTLFYISLAELGFWILISFTPYLSSESYRRKLNHIYTNDFVFHGINIFSYAIIILFIYLLYKSYKSISVTDNAKSLMESILKTRKIIKYYVLYNLIMVAVTSIIASYYTFNNDPEVTKAIEHLDNKNLIIITIVATVILSLFILVIWLFYKLIYGLLLKHLNRNYKELKKLDL